MSVITASGAMEPDKTALQLLELLEDFEMEITGSLVETGNLRDVIFLNVMTTNQIEDKVEG